MKKLNIVLLAIAFTITSIASAGVGKEPGGSASTLTQEIKSLLKKPSFEVSKDVVAQVTFTLNADKEIVVLSVNSENNAVEQFIKSRLNYQKVDSKVNSEVRYYKMPVRINKS